MRFAVIPFDPRLAQLMLWDIGTPYHPMLPYRIQICLPEQPLVLLEVTSSSKGINHGIIIRVADRGGIPRGACIKDRHSTLTKVVRA